MTTAIKAIKGKTSHPSELITLATKNVLVEDGFNVRDFSLKENKEHVKELATSIAAIGLKNPIAVRKDGDKYYLVDGECRLKAALEAGMKELPALVQTDVTEDERTLELLARNDGKDLTLLEKGAVFARLLGMNLTQKQIGERSGLSQGQISNATMLHNGPKKLHSYINQGKIAASYVIDILREHKDQPQKAVAAVEDFITEAEASGSSRATKSSSAKSTRDAFSINSKEGKILLEALINITDAAPGNAGKKVRGIANAAFEEVFGKNWKKGYIDPYVSEYMVAEETAE